MTIQPIKRNYPLKTNHFLGAASRCLLAFLVGFNLILPTGFTEPSARVPATKAEDVKALPPELAQIEALHEGRTAGKPYFVYLQDAHSNPSAQQSIRQILRFLFEQVNNPKILVALEGAVGDLQPELLEFFADFPSVNETIRKDLQAKGELTGAELFAHDLYAQGRFKREQFQGVEDAELYRDHGNAYDQVVSQSAEIERFMAQFQQELAKAETRILNPRLSKFLKEVMRRREGKYNETFLSAGAVPTEQVPQYNAYLKTLADYLRTHLSINLDQEVEQARFPQIFRLRALQRMEELLDRGEAAQEWAAYQADFETTVRPDTLAAMAAAFKTMPAEPRLSVRRALEKLLGENQEAYQALVNSEQLKRMLTVHMLQSELDVSVLLSEMDHLEYAVAQKMVQSLKESLLLQLSKDYRRLGSLFRMELTRPDWLLMKNQPNQLSPESLVQRLKFLGYGKSFKTNLTGFQPYEAASAFYHVAELRDEALLKNTLRKAQETDAEMVVLVSGGFHTGGIREVLESQEYSFAVLRPAIASVDHNQLYHKAMSRDNSNVFNREDLRLSSEQVALTLKEMLEVGIPQIASTTGKTDAELAELVRSAVSSHPLLKDAVEVNVVQDSTQPENAHLIFTTPGFHLATRVKQLYTGNRYEDLQSPEKSQFSWPVDIRGGRPVVELAGLRSEVRAKPPGVYRKYGAARTAEEAKASTGRAIELPSLERVRANIKEYLAKIGRPAGKLTGQEFVEFAGHRNRGYFTGVSAPVRGRDVVTETTLRAFKDEAEKNSSLVTAVQGLENLSKVIPEAEEARNLELGEALFREGKVEVVSLAGGMSVRGAIFANHLVYIPGYGKVPLLGVQILNAYRLAKKAGLKKIPFTVAESDYTAKNVSEVLHWLTQRGFIKVEDVHRFDVSVINRIDGAGNFFAEDHREGYAVASHFDGLLYYIYSGQYARAKQAGVKYTKFSNMNIPTATLDLGIIGYLHARRLAEPDETLKPGVLIEQTLNKNEKGGFRATGHYKMPDGERRAVQQMIESFIVEGTPDFDKLVGNKRDYPVFNANGIVVSLDWIEEFFGLNELSEPPTVENLRDPHYRDQLVALIGNKISDLGDSDPGNKIQLYYELKKIKHPVTEHPEFILQTSRLLGQTATVDPHSIFYTVPRQTEKASRYDEAKKQKNISANSALWAKYLIGQLPKPRKMDKPLAAADTLMAGLNEFYLSADAMNEEAHRGDNPAFKLQTTTYEAEAFDFYNYLLRELDVRDRTQIEEYQGYLTQIAAVPELSQKIHLMQTFMGGRRSEVRFAPALLSTEDFAAQFGDQTVQSINQALRRVSIDFGGVFEDTEPGRVELRAHLELPSVAPLAAAEEQALGAAFITAFFPAEPAPYRQADQYLLRENVDRLPELDAEMKLWVRYLSTHPDFTWGLDVDDASLTELQNFKKELLEFARALGTPIHPGQIRESVSQKEGFDLWLLDRPSKDQVFGYLSNKRQFLAPTQPDAKASFRRTHDARALDRMLAAEALRQQIPDDLQKAIGPLSELAAAVFKTSYASLEAGFAAYQRLAASA